MLVGAGGIGAPAALTLAHAGVSRITIVDDDHVERSNLHRQILFGEADVGRPKAEALADAIRKIRPVDVDVVLGRALPETAAMLIEDAAVVIDGSDNFATRFLLADAAFLASVPIVHGASVRFRGTCFAAAARGGPCYRCFFEDLPEGPAPDCATAGVAGPVCGVIGALAADAALAFWRGEDRWVGRCASFDGLTGALRRIRAASRDDCPLCGPRRNIASIERSRYTKGPAFCA